MFDIYLCRDPFSPPRNGTPTVLCKAVVHGSIGILVREKEEITRTGTYHHP